MELIKMYLNKKISDSHLCKIDAFIKFIYVYIYIYIYIYVYQETLQFFLDFLCDANWKESILYKTFFTKSQERYVLIVCAEN